jgi:hypothetical protein
LATFLFVGTTLEQQHWTRLYEETIPSALAWFQNEPRPSLQALDRCGAKPSFSLIDVGGGTSNLVDLLLEREWRDLTVLDIATSALELSKLRLGYWGSQVRWEHADIIKWRPYRRYDVWHDRAVFHFLTRPEQRQAYQRVLSAATAPGALVIVGTFAPDGPKSCSGLPVVHYDADTLATELGEDFRLMDHWREQHSTPSGNSQPFNWCSFQRDS